VRVAEKHGVSEGDNREPRGIGSEASRVVPCLGVCGAGGEALQSGGDRGLVEVVQVVDHVPPYARQMRRPGGAQPLQASAGELRVVAAAVAGATLALHEAPPAS
jgi:hypothetical protein